MSIHPAGADGNSLDALGSKFRSVLCNLDIHAGLCNRIGQAIVDARLEDDLVVGHAAGDVGNLLEVSLLNQGQEGVGRPGGAPDGRADGLLVELLGGFEVKGHLGGRVRKGGHVDRV